MSSKEWDTLVNIYFSRLSLGIFKLCFLLSNQRNLYYFSTRLTALYHVQHNPDGFVCSIQLPINSPCKELIVGPVMPSVELSKRATALEVCKLLHKMKEIDDYMMPIGKDGPRRENDSKNRSF